MRWIVCVLALGAGPALAADDEPKAPKGWTEIPLAPAPAESDAPTAAAEGTQARDEEIIVWGTAAVREARAAVARRMEELGWTSRGRNSDGDTVFKGKEPWMGSARLTDDGLVSFRRRLIWVDAVRQVEGAPSDGMGALERTDRLQSDGTTTQGGLRGPASNKKIDAARAELLRGVDPQLDRYRRTLAETALQQRLEVLPDRLDRLWADGTPLEPGPYLPDAAARRAAVLDYWATRPTTREGRLVCDAVETWIEAVVQTSPTPATEAELSAAAARRDDGRFPLPRSR